VLSISTVRTHVRNIYRKLNVNKREELLHLIDEG
jgi:DNA-binding CsgD family transcriptional regulator